MDLIGRHIFRVGTWNGQKFTEKDLDDMVANFEKLKNIHHVPLKFGHNEEQPMTDGQPAIGWISRVYREGNDLFADFSHVPEVVMEAIDSRRYRTVSVEIMKNATLDGEEINTWFLDAVALLGADQPAVAGLQDLAGLTALSRTSFEGGSRVMFSKAGNFSSNNGDIDMDQKDLDAAIEKHMKPFKDQIDSLRSDNEALRAENSSARESLKELDSLRDKVKQYEKDQASEKVAASRKAVTEVLDQAVVQRAITPAQREAQAKAFRIDDDEAVVKIDLDGLKAAVGWTKPKDKGRSETFSRSDEEDEMSNLPLDQQVVLATRKVMANKPDLDYIEAQNIALGANPKLARAYLNSNGTYNPDGGVDR